MSSTVSGDGRDLSQWEKIKAGLEPVRVAEIVRSVLLVLSVLGLITTDQVDGVTSAVTAIIGGVLLIVSVALSVRTRNRVTPVNKLDAPHEGV
jgi:hypothetical protein